MTEPWMAEAQRWLHGHAGIVPISTLVGLGCSRRDAYRLVDTDQFSIVMPGILRSCHWPLGAQQLMMAACLRNPLAMVWQMTAAREWKFRKLPPPFVDEDVHVLVPANSSPEMPGVVVHRSRRIDTIDIVRRDDGIRLTSPTRTLFDCADLLGRERSESVLEQLIDDGRGTFNTHASTLVRLGHAGRPGTRTMRCVIAGRPAWSAAMQSDLENRVFDEIRRQGLPMPVTQHRIVLPDGTKIRFDFAWPTLRIALEVDHPFWHAGRRASHRDNHRDLLAATIGWQTTRITDLDVEAGLRATIANVALVLAAH
ncbi:MAG: hypothetical protein JWM34_4225 [Ilumatobacteraceae bacterium]|nr:hypothetical protein [Ilumatobacteraceae bacterium]